MVGKIFPPFDKWDAREVVTRLPLFLDFAQIEKVRSLVIADGMPTESDKEIVQILDGTVSYYLQMMYTFGERKPSHDQSRPDSGDTEKQRPRPSS